VLLEFGIEIMTLKRGGSVRPTIFKLMNEPNEQLPQYLCGPMACNCIFGTN